MERKKENFRAAARDIPAICPEVMVDIERDVPGKTAERIWQAPIQTACSRFISSLRHVRMRVPASVGPAFSAFAFMASTPHHDSTHQQGSAHDEKVFEVLTDHFGEQKGRNRGDHEGDDGKPQWMRERRAVATLSARERGEKLGDALAKIDGQH